MDKRYWFVVVAALVSQWLVFGIVTYREYLGSRVKGTEVHCPHGEELREIRMIGGKV